MPRPKSPSVKLAIADQAERLRHVGLAPIGIVLSDDTYQTLLAELAQSTGADDLDPISTYDTLPIHVIRGEAVIEVTIDAQSRWYEREAYDAATTHPRDGGREEPRFMEIG